MSFPSIAPAGRRLFAALFLALLCPTFVFAETVDIEAVPRKGRVNLVEFGAEFCAPCRVLKPVIEKLQKAYKGRAEILVVDVVKERSAMSKFRVRAIPTLIFFDEDGEEVRRHLGIMDESTIVRQLEIMGVAPPKPTAEAETDADGPEG